MLKRKLLNLVRGNELLQALIRRRMLAILVFLPGLLLMVAYTARQPALYQSSASVLIENYGKSITAPSVTSGVTPEAARAQRGLAESRPVILRLARSEPSLGSFSEPGLPPGFSTYTDGQLLYLQVVDADPQRAARLANAWSAAFVDEMTQRAPTLEAKRVLDKSVPALQQEWVVKQKALNDFERNTQYDPSEFERSAMWKTVDELRQQVNNKEIALAALRAEQDMLALMKAPEELLQIPRARTDVALHSHIKVLEERRSRLLNVMELYKAGSQEYLNAEQGVVAARKALETYAEHMQRLVALEVQKAENESRRLEELLKKAEVQLDGLKAARLGAADALQKGQLAPEEAEIGGKAQHPIPLVARPVTCPPRPANMPAAGQKRSQPRIDRPSRRD